MDLWKDVILVLIGAVASLVGTLAVQSFTQKQKAKHDLEESIVALGDSLAHKRAFALIRPKRVNPDVCRRDIESCRQSVMATRDRIGIARQLAPTGTNIGEALSNMTGFCNTYLHETAFDPANYQFHLMRLREALAIGMRQICHESGIKTDNPGERAYSL